MNGCKHLGIDSDAMLAQVFGGRGVAGAAQAADPGLGTLTMAWAAAPFSDLLLEFSSDVVQVAAVSRGSQDLATIPGRSEDLLAASQVTSLEANASRGAFTKARCIERFERLALWLHRRPWLSEEIAG